MQPQGLIWNLFSSFPWSPEAWVKQCDMESIFQFSMEPKGLTWPMTRKHKNSINPTNKETNTCHPALPNTSKHQSNKETNTCHPALPNTSKHVLVQPFIRSKVFCLSIWSFIFSFQPINSFLSKGTSAVPFQSTCSNKNGWAHVLTKMVV